MRPQWSWGGAGHSHHPGIAYHEISVLILLLTEEVRFTEQPVFNHIFPCHLPHLLQAWLAWSLFFTASLCLLCCFILSLFALSGGYVFHGVLGRGHMRMYLPLSPCLSLHGLLRDLLFALGGALLVARGSAPLHQLGLQLPWATLQCFHCISCCMFTSKFTLYYCGGAFWPPHLFCLDSS